MNIKKQIKELIKTKGLKQVEFANRIKVDQSYISKLLSEKSDAIPSDRLIDDICKEFEVNEEWLRIRQGDMFKPQNTNVKISSFLGEIVVEDKDTFKKKLVTMLAKLTDEEWEHLEKRVNELASK